MVQQLISLPLQLPAVSFYLLDLADVICCKLSFYNTHDCSTCMQTIFGRRGGGGGGVTLAANFGIPDQIFRDSTNFVYSGVRVCV